MFAKRLLVWAGCLFVATQFSSCGDHLPPGESPPQFRVKSLTQVVPEVAGRLSAQASLSSVSAFSYDGQGNLSSIVTQTPSGNVETSTYSYDGQNRLIQLTREIVESPPNPPHESETYSLSYNSASQVAELLYENTDFNGGNWQLTPEYNSDNHLVKYIKRFSTGGLSYFESSTNTFTGNNLTSVSANSTLP
jgi:hypothetical protein